MQVVALGAGHLQMFQAAVTADAVIDVHNEIVGLELAEVLQQLRHVGTLGVPALAGLAEEVRLGNHGEPLLRQSEAFREVTEHELRAHGSGAQRSVECATHAVERHAVILEQPHQTFALLSRAGNDDNPVPFFTPRAHTVRHRRKGYFATRAARLRLATVCLGAVRLGAVRRVVDLQIACEKRPHGQVTAGVGVGEDVQRLQLDRRVRPEGGTPLGGRKVELLDRRQKAVFRRTLGRTPFNLGPRPLDTGVDRRGVVDPEQRVRRQIRRESV